MFVVLKPKHGWNMIGDQFKSHNGFKLPASCRTTHINIQNDFNIMNLNCCQNLNIFQDTNITFNDSAIANLQKLKTESEIASEKGPSDCDGFYECKIVVKGFKDQLVKGQSIWMNNVSL